MLFQLVSILSDNIGTVFTFIVIFFLSSYLLELYVKNVRLPPGPLGLPFVGCLSLLLNGHPDKRQLFAQLRQRYGDIFCFRLGCRLVVVINGFDKLKEAFVHEGDAFSDRPQVFSVTHIGQGKGVVNSSGKVWKEHRKFTLATLRNLGIGHASFEDKVNEELSAFMVVLEQTRGQEFDPQYALQTAVANIVCSIAFGKRFEYDDPVFVRFLRIFDVNMKIAGSTSILNFLPALRHLPGDMFRSRLALKNVEYVQSYLRVWLDNHQQHFNPEDVTDFIDAYFAEMAKKKKNKPNTTFSYDQLLKLVGDLLVGGTETTGTTLRWFLIFLVRWPHVQERIRQEIDAVCAGRTTPSIHHRPLMPYLEAAILECQRFADIAPFCLAHATSRDVTLEGYRIPKGTMVIPNVHSVHFDPVLWPCPGEFRPERFLDSQGHVIRPDTLIPFFMGKRACPGEALARMELFLFIVTILQRFEILPADDGQLPSLDGKVGITYTPCEYKVRFVCRAVTPS